MYLYQLPVILHEKLCHLHVIDKLDVLVSLPSGQHVEKTKTEDEVPEQTYSRGQDNACFKSMFFFFFQISHRLPEHKVFFNLVLMPVLRHVASTVIRADMAKVVFRTTLMLLRSQLK